MIRILYHTTGRYIIGKTRDGLSTDMEAFADDWNISVKDLLEDTICSREHDEVRGKLLLNEFYKRNGILFPISIDEFEIVKD